MTPKTKDAIFGVLFVAARILLMLAIVWAMWPLLFIFANDGVRP
jgi:hypothetical protein